MTSTQPTLPYWAKYAMGVIIAVVIYILEALEKVNYVVTAATVVPIVIGVLLLIMGDIDGQPPSSSGASVGTSVSGKVS
jgi:hypothetical protein